MKEIIYNAFKMQYNLIKPLLFRVWLAFGLWCFTLFIPLFFSMLYLFDSIVTGKFNIGAVFVWEHWLYSGELQGYEAWRWHGGIFFLCFIFVIFEHGIGFNEIIEDRDG